MKYVTVHSAKKEVSLGSDLMKHAKKLIGAGVEEAYGKAVWSKVGGYAGEKKIKSVLEKAETLGFKKKKSSNSDNADGSVIGFNNVLIHPEGWELNMYRSYRHTASSNRYSVTLKRLNA